MGAESHPECPYVRGYWAHLLMRPREELKRHLVIFQIPSSAFIPGNEPTRNLSTPRGDERKDDVCAANALLDAIIYTGNLLLAKGAGVMFLAPLASTVWDVPTCVS